jgi:hypothetical protein
MIIFFDAYIVRDDRGFSVREGERSEHEGGEWASPSAAMGTRALEKARQRSGALSLRTPSYARSSRGYVVPMVPSRGHDPPHVLTAVSPRGPHPPHVLRTVPPLGPRPPHVGRTKPLRGGFWVMKRQA